MQIPREEDEEVDEEEGDSGLTIISRKKQPHVPKAVLPHLAKHP